MPAYRERPEALKELEDGIKKLFQAPKPAMSPFKTPAKPKEKPARTNVCACHVPCRGLVRGRGSCEGGIGETMAEYVAHSQFTTGLIIHVATIVVPERLFIEVTEQMKRFDAHIGAVDAALQQRPEVLKAVGVDAPVDVLDGVVYDLVRIHAGKPFLGKQEVSVESRASLNMLLNFGLQGRLLAIWDNRGDDLAAALQDAHDRNLVLGSGASDAAGFLRKMHVAGLIADEGFVSLALTGQLHSGVVMQSGTDAMKHERCAFLGDAQSTRKFAGTNTVLAVAKNPVSAHPLIESKRAVLEDRTDLDAELLLASRAKPHAAGLDEGVLLRTTTRAADYTVRKAQIERVLESTGSVQEVDDCLLECVRRFRDFILSRIALCIKYVIALLSGLLIVLHCARADGPPTVASALKELGMGSRRASLI